MNRSILFTSAAAALLTISSASAATLRPNNPSQAICHQPGLTHLAQGVVAFRPDGDAARRAVAAPTAHRAADADAILTDVPGSKMLYMCATTGFMSTFMGVFYEQFENASCVVADPADPSTVYIRDIGATQEYNSYVRSHREGNTITVDFPQPIAVEVFEDEYTGGEPEEYTYYACICEPVDIDGATMYVPSAASMQSVTYTVGDDGTISLNLNTGDPADLDAIPPYIVGIVADPTPGAELWLGWGVAYQQMVPFTETAVQVPSDVVMEKWMSTTADGYSRVVEVGFGADGYDLYIRGLNPEMPDAVVWGTVDGTEVNIPTPQFMGDDPTTGKMVFLAGVKFLNDEYSEYRFLEEVNLTYDPSARRMGTYDSSIDMVVNFGRTELFYRYDYYNPEFFYQDFEGMNARPLNPTLLGAEYNDSWQYGTVKWVIPACNERGVYFDTADLYYHVYFDDMSTPYTFDPELYWEFPEPMSEIPYSFTDVFDILIYGDTYNIGYFEPYTNFGLQSLFYGSDGNVYYSDKVMGDAGVENVCADSAAVPVSSSIVDMQGRYLDSRSSWHGLCIRIDRMSDGSTRYTKVMR